MSSLLDISPISYTNKDFRSIYEELLNLINDLTERWDPKSTNESDPGLVLVKLKAFLADKLNYNIDKNTLENFPSQASQRGNAQKLYDILGYGMKYYQAATTTITMRYNKGNNPGVYSVTNKGAYTIPAFTQLTDDSNTINYVTKYNVQVPIEQGNNSYAEVEILEGSIQDFMINGNMNITVDNLDSDYRLYFTETMVAQNGIFINNSQNSTYWEAVDNLEATPLGQRVFKFGVMPVTNTCYIEFPQDAATLFGDGINIKYLVTKGVEGNIGANVLTSITNTLELDDIKELGKDDSNNIIYTDTKADLKNYTLIIQPSSTTSGRDPESLKSAYRNCQKLINTFNTLVTVQDYQNAIYNSGVVSNCVVSDRTNDINNSYKVVNKTVDGNRVLYLNEGVYNKEKETFTPNMTAFDIGVYALIDVKNVSDANSYDRSFQTNATTIYDAQNAIEKNKSIQHDYIATIDTINSNNVKPFIFKNLLSLEGKVLTYQKVTKLEAEEIQSNIKKHLYKTYQSRNIDFGSEINYNDIIEEIKSSDDRIKTVILEYPEYETYIMKSNNKKERVDLKINNYNSLTEKTIYYTTNYYINYLDTDNTVKKEKIKYLDYLNYINGKINIDNLVQSITTTTINVDKVVGVDAATTSIDKATYNTMSALGTTQLYEDTNTYCLNVSGDNFEGVVQTLHSKNILEDEDTIIPDLTELQANIVAKSILSGATPYFIFDNNWHLDYNMGPIDDTTLEDSVINNVAAITTETTININDAGTTLRANENVFCIGPSYVSKAQLSTCLYYAVVSGNTITKVNSNENAIKQYTKYYKNIYYIYNYTPNGSSKIKNQITKDLYDILSIKNLNRKEKEKFPKIDPTPNENGKYNLTYYIGDVKKSTSVSEASYNIFDRYVKNNDWVDVKSETSEINYNEYNHFTEYPNEHVSVKSEIFTTDGKIHANSYYILGENEFLIVAEGLDDDNNLDLSNNNGKKFWIYSKYDLKKGNIIKSTKNIDVKYLSGTTNIITGENYTKISVTSSENLGTSDTIEVFGENKVQINKDNKKIYMAWGVDNLYNQLFDIKKDLYIAKQDGFYIPAYNDNGNPNPKDGYNKYQLRKILQNNDIFLYTDEYKQDLMLLGSGTELIIECDINDYNNIKSPNSNLNDWSMPIIDIASISANGLNSNIEWQEIKNNLSIFTAEKQIVALGEGTILYYNDETKELEINNTPKSLNVSKFSYKHSKEDTSSNSLPSIEGDSSQGWEIFSRLQLVVAPIKGQLLLNGQSVELFDAKLDASGKIKEYTSQKQFDNGAYLTANKLVSLTGGIQQNSAVLTPEGDFENTLTIYASSNELNEVTGLPKTSADIFSAQLDDQTPITTGSDDYKDALKYFNGNENDKSLSINGLSYTIEKNINIPSNYYTINEYFDHIDILFNIPEGKIYFSSFTLDLSPQFQNSLIPVLFISSLRSRLKILGDVTLDLISENTDEQYIEGESNTILNYIKVKDTDILNPSYITIKFQLQGIANNSKLTIYKPLKINRENPLLNAEIKNNNINVKDIFNKLATNDGYRKNLFDYSYQIDEESQILNPLDAESFFLTSHPFNRWVIPQLNTSKDGNNKPYLDILVSKQSYQQHIR